MAECKACDKVFDSERQLHAHLKVHGLLMAEYYQKYTPRYDLHDGSIIKFKNKNYYLTSDFNSRTNLRMWLKGQTTKSAKEYCERLLLKRKQEKELIYAPTQVELRSIMSPPIQYFNELFGDYYKFCSGLGFKSKHQKFDDIISEQEYNKPEYLIYIDTREKKPLKFNRSMEVKKLDYGDYSFSSKTASCNCHIERKSLIDLVNTISSNQNYERFNNEIKKAGENDAYLIVLVEAKFNNALYFNQLRRKNGGRVYSKVKATPEYIFHRIRIISQRYPFVQFLFVDGRKEAVRTMERIFTCGCAFKNKDLQLAYDLDIL